MKKAFFNAAVAALTVVSLSVSAFADSNTTSGKCYVAGGSTSWTADVENGVVSGDGIEIEGLPDNVAKASIEVTTPNVAEDAIIAAVKTLGANLTADDVAIGMSYSVTLSDKDGKEITGDLGTTVTVTLALAGDNENYVSHVDGSKIDEFQALKVSNPSADGSKLGTFTTRHFSEYVTFKVADNKTGEMNSAIQKQNGPSYNNTVPSAPGGGAATTTTTTTTTTTAANSEPVEQVTADNNVEYAPGFGVEFEDDGTDETTTAVATSVTITPDSPNGSTDGAGNDKNQATGVALAIVPAALAAAAVIISKKRK